MSEIIKTLLNGKTVFLEVGDRAFSQGPTAVSAGHPGEQALEVSSELQDSLVGFFGAITHAFNSLEQSLRPAKIAVEFGVKLSADAKFYVVNASGEATVKINAEWAPKS